MADLPVDRTTANTPAEHVADHNALHATHNLIDGDGSNGQVLTRVGGVPTWAAPSGSTVAGYFPDMVPTSPHANDDEFADSTVTGWTEWDPPAMLTVTEDAYGLVLTHSGAAPFVNRYAGVYRAVPAGDWSLTTKVSVGGVFETAPVAGMMIAQDLAAGPSTADFAPLVVGIAQSIAVHHFTDYATFGSTIGTADVGTPPAVYLRIRRVSTTYYYDFSFDGLSWVQIGSSTPSFTVAHVGLVVNNPRPTPVTGRFWFWRQTASGVRDQPLLGQVL